VTRSGAILKSVIVFAEGYFLADSVILADLAIPPPLETGNPHKRAYFM
tara:strand:- start:848 stop:991 length:144 start_codon:yes stop_codon:yes gene_type:complete